MRTACNFQIELGLSDWLKWFNIRNAYQGCKLVAKAFPSTGGHDDENVVTAQRRVDRRQLKRPKRLHLKRLSKVFLHDIRPREIWKGI